MEELGVAITKDMAEIRETELDRPGCFRIAYTMFKDASGKLTPGLPDELFVDRLGRVISPVGRGWERLERVKFENEDWRNVVKREKRYEGDKVIALVAYLEAKEGEPNA